jgi:hypothetical protein
MAKAPERHPLNVPGGFYVENGCCMSCDLPLVIAPSLFAYSQSHCFVKRQPANGVEVSRAVRAAIEAEAVCIRYGGNDPTILRRFAELGEARLCDVQFDENVEPLLRNCTTFGLANGDFESATLVGEALRSYLLGRRKHLGEQFAGKIRSLEETENQISFEYSWYSDDFHRIEIAHFQQPNAKWVIRHDSKIGLSGLIHDWLMSDSRICQVRWHTEEGLSDFQRGTETPW